MICVSSFLFMFHLIILSLCFVFFSCCSSCLFPSLPLDSFHVTFVPNHFVPLSYACSTCLFVHVPLLLAVSHLSSLWLLFIVPGSCFFLSSFHLHCVPCSGANLSILPCCKFLFVVPLDCFPVSPATSASQSKFVLCDVCSVLLWFVWLCDCLALRFVVLLCAWVQTHHQPVNSGPTDNSSQTENILHSKTVFQQRWESGFEERLEKGEGEAEKGREEREQKGGEDAYR